MRSYIQDPGLLRVLDVLAKAIFHVYLAAFPPKGHADRVAALRDAWLKTWADPDRQRELAATTFRFSPVSGQDFFSSRRRHTRYWRDWSSDVCSSDLPQRLVVGGQGVVGALGIAQVGVLGPHRRIVQPGRDRVRVGDLAVLVLEHKSARAVDHEIGRASCRERV